MSSERPEVFKLSGRLYNIASEVSFYGYCTGILTSLLVAGLLFLQMVYHNILKERLHWCILVQCLADFGYLAAQFEINFGWLYSLLAKAFNHEVAFVVSGFIFQLKPVFWNVDQLISVLITLFWNQIFDESRMIKILGYISLALMFFSNTTIIATLIADYVATIYNSHTGEVIEIPLAYIFYTQVNPHLANAFSAWCFLIVLWRVVKVLCLPKSRFSNNTLKEYLKVSRYLILRLLLLGISLVIATYHQFYQMFFYEFALVPGSDDALLAIGIELQHINYFLMACNHWVMAITPLLAAYLVHKFLLKNIIKPGSIFQSTTKPAKPAQTTNKTVENAQIYNL